MHNRSVLIEWRQRWNRNLFQFLRRRVRSSVDVEDLAQETYLRLLRARNGRDSAGSLYTSGKAPMSMKKPPSNNAIDGDTDSAPLRAPMKARHRAR